MRLDMFKLAEAIKAEFRVEIPEIAATKLFSVRDLHAYLIHVMMERGERVDFIATWRRVQGIVIDHLGLTLDQITKMIETAGHARAA
jgi:hypothetical protein